MLNAGALAFWKSRSSLRETKNHGQVFVYHDISHADIDSGTITNIFYPKLPTFLLKGKKALQNNEGLELMFSLPLRFPSQSPSYLGIYTHYDDGNE